MTTEQPNLTNSDEVAKRENCYEQPTILCDTRQQKDLHIVDHFDRKGIAWKRCKVEAGDYQLDGDPTVLIDTKKDLMELCANLTRKSEHERVIREIERGRELGCPRFIFLIADPKIKFVDEVYTWKRPMDWRTKKYRTKVLPETLQKIMITFAKNHNCEFLFCTKLQMGRMVASLLLDRTEASDEAREQQDTTI
jgi:hypothetical protein